MSKHVKMGEEEPRRKQQPAPQQCQACCIHGDRQALCLDVSDLAENQREEGRSTYRDFQAPTVAVLSLTFQFQSSLVKFHIHTPLLCQNKPDTSVSKKRKEKLRFFLFQEACSELLYQIIFIRFAYFFIFISRFVFA
jgi:hypothetical protein